MNGSWSRGWPWPASSPLETRQIPTLKHFSKLLSSGMRSLGRTQTSSLRKSIRASGKAILNGRIVLRKGRKQLRFLLVTSSLLHQSFSQYPSYTASHSRERERERERDTDNVKAWSNSR